MALDFLNKFAVIMASSLSLKDDKGVDEATQN